MKAILLIIALSFCFSLQSANPELEELRRKLDSLNNDVDEIGPFTAPESNHPSVKEIRRIINESWPGVLAILRGDNLPEEEEGDDCSCGDGGQALMQQVLTVARPLDADKLADLEKLLLSSDYPPVPAAVLGFMIPGGIEILGRTLDTNNPSVTRACAANFGWPLDNYMKAPPDYAARYRELAASYFPKLISLLSHEDPRVGSSAMIALRRFDDPTIHAAAEALATDGSKPFEKRRRGIVLLEWLEYPAPSYNRARTISILTDLTAAPDKSVAEQATRTLDWLWQREAEVDIFSDRSEP